MRRACIIWTIALCLAVCISVVFCSTESVEIQAATGSFTVPEPTPTPTPTPSPTPTPTVPPVTPTPSPSPTPTATPTVTPIPTPTTPGGGGSQPSISLKLSIHIMGEKTEWLRNSASKVLEDITATSADGKITLKIFRGTFALDADGEPLTEIYITVVDPLVKAPPLTPPTNNYFIYIYEFLPDGSSFSEPIEIKVTYDPSDLPKSPDELTLQMYALNGAPNEWEGIPGLLDIKTNTIICSINHLSIYALIAAPLGEPAPTPQDSPMPTPTSSAPHNSSLILLILILPAASLTFFIYVLLRWRRRNNTAEDDDL